MCGNSFKSIVSDLKKNADRKNKNTTIRREDGGITRFDKGKRGDKNRDDVG
eukprot:CAMPEP_0194389956 /NCGR_PEP_ID=MMETSP0174-20130528/107061_1 /TAXON_ID=216777 /ORGANISM="Proboscia alata, Strain PI-D3" /LENGTH=50 /DNA_ID=CAMNT_0039182757 /DNA_START=43 /DNA_END=191 /DNA_ORIENTATION=+